MADLSPGLGMISTRTSRSSMSSSINPLPLMRRTSDSSTPSTPSTDNPPVISISRLDAEEFGAHKRSYDLVRVASASDSLLPSLSTVSQSLDDEMYVPVHPCPADLSTILEAENSGISKYIPSASPSPSPSPTSPHTFFPSKVTFSPPPTQGTFPIPKDRSASRTSCDPSPTTSNLDLSFSKLSAELHDALSPTTAAAGSQIQTQMQPLTSKGHGRIITDKLVPDGFSIAPYQVAASIPQTPGPRVNSTPLPELSTTPLSPGCSSVEPLSREPTTPLSPSIRPSTVPQLDARSLVSLGSRPSRGVVHSPEPMQLPISRPSLNMRRPPSHLPRLVRSVTSASPSIAASTPGTSVETAARMQRYQPPSPLSAGQVTTDTVMRSSSDTTGLRVSSDSCVPRPSVDISFMPRSSSDTGTRNARVGSAEQNQHPKLQGHITYRAQTSTLCPPGGHRLRCPVSLQLLHLLLPAPSTLSGSPSTTLTTSPSATTTSANPRTPTSSPPQPQAPPMTQPISVAVIIPTSL
ncbi:hypothetical protein BD769DRAFT_1691815 [Suillus cothurnatus]|nr:hypothetical protein BD769DRAFT_1691815 [Suillus cothurnatus]